MPIGISPTAANSGSIPQIRDARQAANAFEALMLKQLLNAMSKSVGKSDLLGGGFENDMYSDMFNSAVAEQSSGSNGGLSSMIQNALGIGERQLSDISSMANFTRGLDAYRASLSGTEAPPTNTSLIEIAQQMINNGAERWGKAGELTTDELSAKLETNTGDGYASFNVEDASGYKGHPKCNLFAFEMLRRAGFAVPVRPRSHGWGYPGATITAKLGSEAATNDWAEVKSAETAASLDKIAKMGQPLLLASGAEGDAAGHMAVADRIHTIQRDSSGSIAAIEYSGWEARKAGAQYGRRVWRLSSVKGQGRGGLDQIEVLQPKSAAINGTFHQIAEGHPGASVKDQLKQNANSIQVLSQGTDIDIGEKFGTMALEATK